MSETLPRSSIVRLHRPKLLHVSVQESLKAYIADNRLASGSPLPPELLYSHISLAKRPVI